LLVFVLQYFSRTGLPSKAEIFAD